MVVSERPWEKRNLGVESCAFYIKKDENAAECMKDLGKYQHQYQVMYIQWGNAAALKEAQKHGFIMTEMNLHLQKKLNTEVMPSIYKRYEQHLAYSIASSGEQEWLLQTIRTGKIFTTDRVAMDSHFGLECAGRRYAYWAEDVLADGATLLLMKYKEKVISFDILVGRDNETVDAILGGLLPEFEASGLGFVGLYLISQWAKGENYKKIVTNVASNNLPILRLHELFGYGVDDLAYVLTKYL